MKNEASRYLDALRRSQAPQSRGARTAAIGALLVLPISACSNTNDADVFAASDVTVAPATSDTATSDTATSDAATDTADSGAAESSTTITTIDGTTTALETTTSVAAAGALFPAGADVVIDFTYDSSGADRARNPYIAVWIEDADGNLVKTVSLWYEQGGKGSKWLSDLTLWSRLTDSTADESVSGATKVAGSYTVAWDGTNDSGETVAQGSYVLNIEAAREHGPYEIISESIVVDDAGFAIDLTPSGELTAAAARLEP